MGYEATWKTVQNSVGHAALQGGDRWHQGVTKATSAGEVITNLQAESNCLENIYRYKQASLYFSFIYCTCACKHLKFTYPFRHLKTFIPSHHQLSQKKVIFSPQKKKKIKDMLPWKLGISACVLQPWWLKHHSGATSYHPPRLLKVCATFVPDLHSSLTPKQCAWHFSSAQVGLS